MVDGRSLIHLGQSIVNPQQSLFKSFIKILPPDWLDIVNEGKPTLKGYTAEPCFLGAESPILTAKELFSKVSVDQESHKGSIFLEMGLETIKVANGKIQQQSNSRSTITGLMLAVLMKALADSALGAKDRSIGISTLVDLRPYVKTTLQAQIPQCHGSVTVSLSCQRLNSQPVADLARILTLQLQTRIQRGEAHRCAVLMCQGHFESASPPATMELSNLGIVGTDMYTAQRFDGYDGVSCMVHSGNRVVRIATSVGAGLDCGRVQNVMECVVRKLSELGNEI